MRALFDLDRQQTIETDVAVIGGGIVGLAAAKRLKRSCRPAAARRLRRRTSPTSRR
jgi:cation diffusion facilitator CzcD-associated flavoprotein CzcO